MLAEFETEMQAVLGAIMGRYSEIVACVSAEPHHFARYGWESLIRHRRAEIMMMPLMLLNGDAELHIGTDEAVDEDQFMAEVPDIIPACVLGIYEFWYNTATRHMGEDEVDPEAVGVITEGSDNTSRARRNYLIA